MGTYIIVMCCFVMAWGKQNDGLKHRVEILEKAIQSLPDVDSLTSRIERLESLLDVITDVSSLEQRVERLETFHGRSQNFPGKRDDFKITYVECIS